MTKFEATLVLAVVCYMAIMAVAAIAGSTSEEDIMSDYTNANFLGKNTLGKISKFENGGIAVSIVHRVNVELGEKVRVIHDLEGKGLIEIIDCSIIEYSMTSVPPSTWIKLEVLADPIILPGKTKELLVEYLVDEVAP